ncbi:MAG: aminotransferase [Herpetosiphonaceae bacterium]|nr:MAG: aminotransferase [Herpetosiphonaceae bacterium]
MIDVAALRSAEFPVTERYTYLNHASLGPLPRRTTAALTELLADFSRRGVLAEARWMPAVERVRRLVSRLLNVEAEDIALVKNTSEGLGLIAAGLPWRPGDVVISAAGEFPANIYPWLALADQDVDTRLVPLREGRIKPEDIAAAIDSAEGRARLVSLSWVQYHNGFRCDLAALGAICRERGVLFGIDAIQGAGVLPLDLQVTPVDFCAFGCHKWMLSPQGSGAIFLSANLRSLLRPINTGWLGVDWEDYSAFDYASPLKSGAARYEEGTRSLLGIAGLEQSLGLLCEIGVETIARRLQMLTSRLVQGLLACGVEVYTPLDPACRSGIVSFAVPGAAGYDSRQATAALFEALKKQRIVTALRQGAIRISPHVYNTEEEIDLVLDVVSRHLRLRVAV